ncbi:MAG: type II secretion system F family protein [Acidimicrobiia bacterium]|nr:MAG: type II secretion system F family protein [Acidimicrobiia bacterium]
MTALVAALAIATGRPVPLASAAILLVGLVVPGWLLVAALVTWSRRTGSAEDGEVEFFTAASAHLASGLSLRHALALAGDEGQLHLQAFRRKLVAGVPLDECARDVAAALPRQGPALAHALTVSARSGGGMGPLFDRLADRAATSLELDREARTASAAARASLVLLGGLPFGLASARLTTDSTDMERVLLAAGLGLIGLGSAAGWALVRRVRP